MGNSLNNGPYTRPGQQTNRVPTARDEEAAGCLAMSIARSGSAFNHGQHGFLDVQPTFKDGKTCSLLLKKGLRPLHPQSLFFAFVLER
jgi:hypothetical protein